MLELLSQLKKTEKTENYLTARQEAGWHHLAPVSSNLTYCDLGVRDSHVLRITVEPHHPACTGRTFIIIVNA